MPLFSYGFQQKALAADNVSVWHSMIDTCSCMNIPMIIEVFASGTKILRDWAHAFPQTVLSNRLDRTDIRYLYTFTKWKQWMKKKSEFAVFPVKDLQFYSTYSWDHSIESHSWSYGKCSVMGTSTGRLKTCCCFSPCTCSIVEELLGQLVKPKEKKALVYNSWHDFSYILL